MNAATKACLASFLIFGLAVSSCLGAGEVVGRPVPTGADPRVDNWVDIWMLAQTGPAGQAVEGRFAERHDLLDTTDAKQGLFAVRFTVGKKARDSAFGFYTGPYLKQWALAGDFTLHAWIKASAATAPARWPIVLYDVAGHKAQADLAGMAADGKWREYSLPLASFESRDGFAAGAIRAVQVEVTLPQGANLWLDDVFFQRGQEILGVSDKTITQFMAEAAATRPQRVAEALANARDVGTQPSLAPLYTGVGLEEANRKIIAWTEQANDGLNGTWGLFTNVFINEAYFGYSSKGKIKPGRLSAECERKLLDYYWKHCELKNDIASARQSSWWVTGSENHDFNLKMSNLLSSQIFMHEPEYAARIYPDLGRMQGYGYGDSPAFRAGKTVLSTKLGSGHYKDGKPYKASDHYQAWVEFWKDYFAQRARHGFFIENNAATYSSHTGAFLHDIYAWCEDEPLRREARMFLDLVWAQWAQDQALGFTGGSVTRGSPGWARLGRMAEFLMGGPGNFYALSDYQWPRQVWEMLLARPAMGEYAYVARKPNEAQDVWPQPPGTEYTMIIRPDSRLVHYSWVTPDYVMGTRMDHPDALYCHLSESKEGIIFATTPQAQIEWVTGPHLAVQDRNVALIQPKKTIRYQHPAWFPGYTTVPEPLQVLFGADLDRVEEKDGWVFAQEGNAYAAIRVVAPAADTMEESTKKKGRIMPTPMDFDADGFGLFKLEPNPYTWQVDDQKHKGILLNSPRKLVAKDPDAALIVEASRKAHHATLEAFEQDVLKNPIRLKQVIASGYLLTYRGCGKDARELYLNCANNETPKIDGKYIRYDSPTFDSPWLKGAFGSGVITLTGPISGSRTVLDFNRISCEEVKGK